MAHQKGAQSPKRWRCFLTFLKGFEYREAPDGRQGVEIFRTEGPFE